MYSLFKEKDTLQRRMVDKEAAHATSRNIIKVSKYVASKNADRPCLLVISLRYKNMSDVGYFCVLFQPFISLAVSLIVN